MNSTQDHPTATDDFGAFMDALRQRFGGEAEAADEDLLVLLDETEGPSNDRSDSESDEIPEPELPIELAPKLVCWRRLTTELAVGFGTVAALELLLGPGIGSPGIAPHPYWLVVLPIAAARGFVAGMVTALIAATLIFVGTGASLESGRAIELLSYEHGMQPLAMLLGAFVVGQIADGAASRHRELWRRLVHQSEDFALAVGSHRRLQRSNRDLKVRLLDHRAQFGHLLDAARRLESATREDLYAVALDMVIEHCAAERCSVVSLAGDAAVVLASQGWDGNDAAILEDLRQSQHVRAAWESGDRFDAFGLDRAAPRGPILVFPLHASDGGRQALLCLDSMSADRYHQGLASIFFGIGEWTQTGLDRLRKGERVDLTQPHVGAALQQGNRVGTTDALRRRLHREQGRVKRGAAVSLLTIRAVGPGAWTPNDLQRLDMLMDATVLNGVVRGSDGVFRLPTAGAWMVVLPHTPQEFAPVVQRQLDAFLRPLSFARISGFEVEVVERDDEVDLAQAAETGARAIERAAGVTSAAPPLPEAEESPGWDDSSDLARRLSVEGALARRRGIPLFAMMVGFDRDPQAADRAERTITEVLARCEDSLVSAHSIGPGRAVLVIPETDAVHVFSLAEDMGRSLALSTSGAARDASRGLCHVRATTGEVAELAALTRCLVEAWDLSSDAAKILDVGEPASDTRART